jgi:hypothetical protein
MTDFLLCISSPSCGKYHPFTTAYIRKLNALIHSKTCCKLLNLETFHVKEGHVKCRWHFSKDYFSSLILISTKGFTNVHTWNANKSITL